MTKMQKIRIEYAPTPKQRLFHQATADEVLFGGAAGGGKSKAIVMDALLRCLKHPGTHAYIFRRTYTELEDTIIREMEKSYPEGIGRYNVGRHEWTLINGSMIHLRHCASIGNMYDYKGAEIHWLYFDELTSFESEIYNFIKTRLRSETRLGVYPIVRSASNPGDIGHAWVKAYFVDAGEPLEVVTRTIDMDDEPDDESLDVDGVAFDAGEETRERDEYTTQYIPSLANENPHITKQYIRELKRKPKALRDAYLFGKWDAFEGQVFTEFTDDKKHYGDGLYTHVINPFTIPPHWPRAMSFDWGFSRPFSVCWWASSPNGTAYLYREWYGWNGTPNQGLMITPEQIAQGILKLEAEEANEGLAIDRICDPSMFDRSHGDSFAQKFADKGVVFRRGENNRLPGKAELHERLRFRKNGMPMLYVFSTCKQFIRTIPALPYSLSKPEDVNSDAEDHIYDSTRYFLMSRPICAREKPPAAPVYGPGDPFGR